MKTTLRFENAVQKLYDAFHGGSLNPECCRQCAVGNILDNSESWKHLSDEHGSLRLNYVGKVNEGFGKRFNGYTPQELLQIEAAFLQGCGYSLPLRHNGRKPVNHSDMDVLFNGLSAAISCLCGLDGISDLMDHSSLLEYVPKQAVHIAEVA